MNKMLWIMTQNKEDCTHVQNKVVVELLKKQEIIGYGLAETSNYDHFFNGDNCFWMLLDENQDYLNCLKQISQKASVPILGRFNNIYYFFDAYGFQQDNGNWLEENAKNFVEQNWDLFRISKKSNGLISFGDYYEQLDDLFDKNIIEEDLYSKEWKIEDNDIKNSISDFDSSLLNLDLLNKTIDESNNNLEIDWDNNAIKNSVSIDDKNNNDFILDNLFVDNVVNEKKYCGSENCKCKVKDENLEQTLCDKCFQKNCVCTDDEKESDFDFVTALDTKFECSPENCESCTGCNWDFDESDNNFYQDSEDMSHHFECVCEGKEDCACEKNNDFMDEFVIFKKDEDSSNVEHEHREIDNDAIVEHDNFDIISDNVAIVEPNINIFSKNENDLKDKNHAKEIHVFDELLIQQEEDVMKTFDATKKSHNVKKTFILPKDEMIFNPIDKSKEQISYDNFYDIDWNMANKDYIKALSNKEDWLNQLDTISKNLNSLIEPIETSSDQFNLDFNNFNSNEFDETDNVSKFEDGIGEFKVDSLNELIDDLNSYIHDSKNFEVIVDESINNLNKDESVSYDLKDMDDLSVDIINADKLDSLVEKYNSKFNEIESKEKDHEKILDEILEVVSQNTKDIEFESSEFINEFKMNNTKNNQVKEFNLKKFETKKEILKPIISLDIETNNKIVFDYEKEKNETVSFPTVTIDFTNNENWTNFDNSFEKDNNGFDLNDNEVEKLDISKSSYDNNLNQENSSDMTLTNKDFKFNIPPVEINFEPNDTISTIDEVKIEQDNSDNKQIDSNLYVDFNEYISTNDKEDTGVSYENEIYFQDNVTTNFTNSHDETENIIENININQNFDAPLFEDNNQNFQNNVVEQKEELSPQNEHIEAAKNIFIDTSKRKIAHDKSISKELKKFLIELNKEKDRLKRKREEIQKRNRRARMLFSKSNYDFN